MLKDCVDSSGHPTRHCKSKTIRKLASITAIVSYYEYTKHKLKIEFETSSKMMSQDIPTNHQHQG
jgi:hypothetical protein